MTIYKNFAHGIDLNEIEPVGVVIPEEHPDFLWRDPEEVEAGIDPEDHPYFGGDVLEFDYITWEDEDGRRFESLYVDDELTFKIGPVTGSPGEPTCERVMELLEDLHVVGRSAAWYTKAEYTLHEIVEPGGWCSQETLEVDGRVKLECQISRHQIEIDAPIITCRKVITLLFQVRDAIVSENGVTFKYTYMGKPRVGVFASNDFAA